MLSNLFDEYSINARVRPALLAFLPLAIFAYLIFPQLYSILAGAISIFVVFGLVTALAHVSRSAGRNVEKKLFSKWGGRPTTILLRHRNNEIDPITKSRYHSFLTTKIDAWEVPSKEYELNNPKESDQIYDSAVKWLLEYTRDTKKNQILFKENISYGFRRNCYGIKWLATILALIPIIVVLVELFIYNFSIISIDQITSWATVLFSTSLFCWWVFIVKEEWVKDAAIAYAVRLLGSCEQ